METAADSKDFGGQSQLTVRLLELTQATNYELVQENGQRRLTAPEWTAELRGQLKGAEVFIGHLPRDCYEDEIVPILQPIGRLLELRLMLDFSGSTRAYAFALFENASVARRACRALDGHEIRPGHRIGVVKSIDNCRLFFGGVPKDKTKQDFMDELGKILDGITDIFLYPNAQDRSQNRGFIFVEFKDHRAAAMARRRLIPGRVILWNHEIAVDWADPEPGDPVDDDVMESVTALFVRNLSLETPHQKIREVFQKSTGDPVLKLKKINHFAFVHYENRQHAQHALEVMTQPGGIATLENWEVRWAKPISSSTKSADRQKSINDAVKKTCNHPEAAASSAKRAATKKRSKKPTNPEMPTTSPRPQIDFRRFLETFVKENFGASCRFEFFSTNDFSHVCKVTIVGDGNLVLCNFQGNNFNSKQEAVDATCREVYLHLHFAIQNRNPLLRGNSPVSYDSPKFLQSSKVEACR